MSSFAIGQKLAKHIPVLIATVFLLLLLPPVFAVLGAASWDWTAFNLLQRKAIQSAAWFSVSQAALSAFISVVLSLPGAWFLSHLRFPGKRFIQSLTLLPFVLPSLIIVLAIISMYGRAGLLSHFLKTDLSLVYSPFGIILAHVLFNISVGIRMISGGYLSIDQRFFEVSSSLGEKRFSRIWHLDLPLLLPSIVSAFTIIFLYCFVSFGIVLIFGGVQWTTLEVRIYQEMFQNLNLQGAAVLAFLQICLSGCIVLLLQIFVKRKERTKAGKFRVKAWMQASLSLRLTCTLYWTFLGIFFFSPFVTLIFRAFRPGGTWSFAAFHALLISGRIGDRDLYEIMRTSLPELLRTSLFLACVSAILCSFLAYSTARLLRNRYTPILDALFMLPLAISSVTISLGMRLLWVRIIPPFLIIAFTQSIMAFPMVFRIHRNAIESFPRVYTEAAQSLGGRWLFRLCTLDFPVLHRALVNGFILAFALGLADFTAVLTIGRGTLVTFPVALYRLLGFQSFDAALALGVLYIGLVLLVFWAIDATSYQHEDEGL